VGADRGRAAGDGAGLATPLGGSGRSGRLIGNRLADLPPDLIAQVDQFAAEDRRSRSNMVEIILGEYVKARAARQEAA